MGTDKAEVLFGGRTMLEIAVETMACVCDDVIVVGKREKVPEGAFCIPDTHPGCGPMGGIAAALQDCRQNATEVAVFLPVDLPLMPGGLLRALTDLWSVSTATRLAVAFADGRIQPLVSMFHTEISPTLEAALARGDYSLQPALRRAAQSLAEALHVSEHSVFLTTSFAFRDRVVLTSDGRELCWTPSDLEWDRRSSWFANLNTPADLLRASSSPG